MVVGVFLYSIITRNQNRQREEDERTAAVVGSFPIVVSKQKDSSSQKAQEQDEAYSRNSGLYDMSSPQYITSPPDLLGRHESGSDDSDGDEGVPLHVFHDDDHEGSPQTFPQGVSTSWRDQILRNPQDESSPFGDGGISLDPNQPFVQPILDEEVDKDGFPSRGFQSPRSQSSQYHSVYSEDYEYPDSYYAGSSLTDSDPHSSPERRSPSKLSVAFDRGEII